MFDANCPGHFAANERSDYLEFLQSAGDEYEVCQVNEQVCGAFGVGDTPVGNLRIRWILLDPDFQGQGIGSKMMSRMIDIGRNRESRLIEIAASHKSAPFFARFGAKVTQVTEDGWGIGMDRVDMELPIIDN